MDNGMLLTLISVATLLQIICIFVVPRYCDEVIKECVGNPSKSKLESRAKRGKEINMWVLMVNMIVKVAIENRLSWPTTKPSVWVIDMLLMNLIAVILVRKYIFQSGSKS